MTQHKVLIVGPSWIGDMVMAQSLFRDLKQNQKASHLAVLAMPWTKPLLTRMPEVDQILDWPFSHGQWNFSGRRAFGKTLRADHFDQAIVLPNSWKSAVVPAFANITKRTGWLGELRYGLLNDATKLDKQAYPLMVDRYRRLAYAQSDIYDASQTKQFWPKLGANRQAAETRLAQLGLSQLIETGFVALCPGAAYGPSKQWPAERWAKLAALLAKDNRQTVILGSDKDRDMAQKITKLSDTELAHNLAGQLTLGESIDVMSLCQGVVTHDSGLMHVAAALGKSLVAIYGSTTPKFTPPLTDQAQLCQVDNLACRPCFKRTCPYGHYQCLTGVEVDRVFTLCSFP